MWLIQQKCLSFAIAECDSEQQSCIVRIRKHWRVICPTPSDPHCTLPQWAPNIVVVHHEDRNARMTIRGLYHLCPPEWFWPNDVVTSYANCWGAQNLETKTTLVQLYPAVRHDSYRTLKQRLQSCQNSATAVLFNFLVRLLIINSVCDIDLMS